MKFINNTHLVAQVSSTSSSLHGVVSHSPMTKVVVVAVAVVFLSYFNLFGNGVNLNDTPVPDTRHQTKNFHWLCFCLLVGWLVCLSISWIFICRMKKREREKTTVECCQWLPFHYSLRISHINLHWSERRYIHTYIHTYALCNYY